MVTQSEVEKEVDERSKVLEGIKVSDSVKNEVASAALVLECCFAAAKDLEHRMEHTKNSTGVHDLALRHEGRREIALALFECIIARSTQQQPQPGFTFSHKDLRIPGVG